VSEIFIHETYYYIALCRSFLDTPAEAADCIVTVLHIFFYEIILFFSVLGDVVFGFNKGKIFLILFYYNFELRIL
jgi:hypothetical protein